MTDKVVFWPMPAPDEKSILTNLPVNPGSGTDDEWFRIELRSASAVLFSTQRPVLITGRNGYPPDPPMHMAIVELKGGVLRIVPTSAGFGSGGEIIQYAGSIPHGKVIDFKSWHEEEIVVDLLQGAIGGEQPLSFVIATDEGKKFVTHPVVSLEI
jgi:hypothetical protein